MGRNDEIKMIAYHLWEEENCPDGRDCEHWFRAEAIWEEQSKRTIAVNTKAESEYLANKGTPVKAARKLKKHNK
jgi:hypothetical protein